MWVCSTKGLWIWNFISFFLKKRVTDLFPTQRRLYGTEPKKNGNFETILHNTNLRNMYDKAEALQNLRACLHQAKERAKAKDQRTIKNIKERATNIQKVFFA